MKAAGCEVVRAEKVSGTSRNGSEELKTILDFIRAGDVLVLKRLVGWRSFTTAIGALARKNSLWMKFDSTVKQTARDAPLHGGDASGFCRRTFAETLRETRRGQEP